ncbi:MAG: hypothetical protein HFH15_00490 [Ruminococcus sp.]|jgi:hypothetical protein|nr:hypothetical protein [Ruminococcus sp.]
MEQKYWEQFMKTGGICDYLGYKMEAYGHGKGKGDGQEKQKAHHTAEAMVIPLYSQDDDTA